MSAVLPFPTDRKQPYPNRRVSLGNLPDGVVALRPVGPPQRPALPLPKTASTLLLMSILADMTPTQRCRVAGHIKAIHERSPDDEEAADAYELLMMLPCRTSED